MEYYQIRTTKKTDIILDIPKYFRTNNSHYFKIVSHKSYVAVSFYDTTKDEMESLMVHPHIDVRMLDQLYIFVNDQDIIELTKEEFNEKFDACMAFIDQL
jgi:hypothetical protein